MTVKLFIGTWGQYPKFISSARTGKHAFRKILIPSYRWVCWTVFNWSDETFLHPGTVCVCEPSQMSENASYPCGLFVFTKTQCRNKRLSVQYTHNDTSTDTHKSPKLIFICNIFNTWLLAPAAVEAGCQKGHRHFLLCLCSLYHTLYVLCWVAPIWAYISYQ